MNKSIKVAILCSGLLGLNLTAFAQIQTSFEDTYYVDVKYINEEAFAKATIQIIDENKEYPLYASESKNVTYTPEEGYAVSFKRFKLNDSLSDGEYKIRVGVNSNVEEITFEFINTPAKLLAMQNLKDAQSEADFISCIERDYIFLGLDVDRFNALGDYKTQFYNALFAGLEFDDGEVTADNLEQYKTILLSEIDKQFEVLGLMNAKENLVQIVDGLQIISVDKTYYDKLTDKTELVRIYSAYTSDEEINLDNILKRFDGACLCAVINTCDYKTVEEALLYYANKAVIENPDMNYYNKLSNLKKSEVFKKLAKNNISDYSDVTDEFESIAKAVYDQMQKENNKSGGSSGGGGGGSSVSAGIILTPKNDEDDVTEENEEKETIAETTKVKFPDIDSVKWAIDSINALADDGCISGDENGFFNPHNKITREEFVKIVVTAFGKYENTALADFSDVDKNAWYFPYIASGIKAGIINGISDNEFGTGLNITRQDAAVVLGRIYSVNSSYAAEMNFNDSDIIADYAKQAISDLSSIGVITGMDDGNFYPENSLTRAEAATLIYRLKNIIG